MAWNIEKHLSTKGEVTYYIRVELPPDPKTGKRRQKRVSSPIKREAERLAREIQSSVDNGGFAEAHATKITVEQYLEQWIESIDQTVTAITKHRYEDLLRLHVKPILGKLQLAKLTALDLQRLYGDRLTEGKLSATTVNNIHVVLHKALKDAVRFGMLTRNVTEAVTPPRKVVPQTITWTQQQAAAFLAASDKDELAPLWRLALFTGMRRGELLGLKWEDVDLARKVVAVRRTRSRSAEGGFAFGEPKSAHSRRSIAISDSVVQSLQRHRAKQTEHKWHLGEVYKDQGMVFATLFGDPIHPNTLALHFHRLCATAGVPKIRIHDLRHTSATLMLANNVHPKIVQERLGHSDVGMTLNRYSHVTMDMQREAADKLDDLMHGS
jgi:integrase